MAEEILVVEEMKELENWLDRRLTTTIGKLGTCEICTQSYMSRPS